MVRLCSHCSLGPKPHSLKLSRLVWLECKSPSLLSTGVSHEALKYADQPVIIPQAPGFVDSFNVSVAAAMILYEAFTWRTRHLGSHGDLDEMQQRVLTAAMLLRHKVLISSPTIRQSMESFPTFILG